jgi:Icc-related predicted phosphoesterase
MTSTTAVESMCQGLDTIKFAFITDSQGAYDELSDAVDYINSCKDIMFVIHGGDQSDFGITKEFLWCRDIMDKLHCPYFCLLGNHDCLGTGEHVYKEIFGNPNFSFHVGNTLFICLNTNALEYDYSEPVPDFEFLENLMTELPEHIKRTIVVMHAPPFDSVFNNNVAKVFQLYLKNFPGLMFCLHGHLHQYTVSDLFQDGILYFQTPNVGKRLYLLFTINEEGYEYEVVEF